MILILINIFLYFMGYVTFMIVYGQYKLDYIVK